ncbi:lipase family protein [Nocardia nova]|uniref:lipase family protein n=1 Tax=Nocardia nova TaxID=37330 RepID=UPI0007A55983|nr:lipase family protein [Nocardia nova]
MSDFYTAPVLEQNHVPGELVRMRPAFVPQLPGAVAAWQIVYVSRDSQGALTPASGIVIIPDTDTGPEAMLVYYPAFRGLGGPCAPSRSLVVGADPDTADIAVLAEALTRGWVVAVPDGECLGLTGMGPHTFLAARAGGQIVLDLARAARLVPDLAGDGETARMPLLAWGYADGGRAVAAAGELHAEYAPELDLRGLCAGAVVSDLAAVAHTVDAGAYSALGVAGLIGLARAYPHLPLLDVLTEEGRELAARADALTVEHLLDWYRQPLAHWCRRPDPWNDAVWRWVLAGETLAHTAPMVPMRLYHGVEDQIVPVTAGRRTMIAYLQRGADVSWREYNRGHLTTATEARDDAFAHLGHTLSAPTDDGHQPMPGADTARA